MQRITSSRGALTLILVVLAATTLFAATTLCAAPPRPSPTATVSQVVGVADVEITYARPSVRERVIWGELVPYGQVWRTGANEATRITFSHDAEVQGKPVPAGTYALFTKPEKDRWTIVLNEEAEQWGAFNHDASKDALVVEAKPHKAPHQEQFAIGFADVTDTSAKVVLHWETLAVPFEVEFDTHKLAYDVALKESAENPQASFGWAQYFYQEEIYTEKALEWANAAVEARPMYWTLSLKARLQERSGQKGAAVELAKKAIEMAEGGENQFAKNAAAQLKEEMGGW